ncbi:thiamine pyrophosphate-binding protein [[Actinomadura] parvosata]|uniref:thiamine pyrophosphate-binding protein n=1 Tax=[Actinomadura] parvosata TaxID=1955412 RepID=UPI00406CC76B
MTRQSRLPGEIANLLPTLDVRTVFGTVNGDCARLAAELAQHQTDLIIARHEAGAAAMAAVHARISGQLAVLLLDRTYGFAAAAPGLAVTRHDHVPILVLGPHDQTDGMPLVGTCDTLVQNLQDLRQANAVVVQAARTARDHQRPVLLRIASQEAAPCSAPGGERAPSPAPVADPAVVGELAGLLAQAQRPVFIVGRGAARAAEALERLAERTGALLATSVATYGLFTASPWHIGISGALATPDMAAILTEADLVVAWGCSLDPWTTRRGTLFPAQAHVAQIDIDPAALGLHHRIDLGVAGDAARTAEALQQALPQTRTGYRTEPVRERIATHSRWKDVGYQPALAAGRIDPRTLSLLLDTILPAERTLTVELGTTMGPAISQLQVPDADGFCLIPTPGLGLAGAVGAALARRDRLAIAVLDIDSTLMAAAELETAARHRVPLLIVVHDDSAGAEPGAPGTHATDPAVDLALIAAAHGCPSAVIRRPADLTVVSEWLAGPHDYPLLLHAQVTRNDWWFEDVTTLSTGAWHRV